MGHCCFVNILYFLMISSLGIQEEYFYFSGQKIPFLPNKKKKKKVIQGEKNKIVKDH